MNVIALIQALDILLRLASSVGVSVSRLQAMREANPDGKLSDEQIDELAGEARRAVDDM